ncbi:NAD(P)H-dependent oxidoreductase [Acidobacteriota bacterium]
MTHALLLVGSPRGKKSTSTSLGRYLMNNLEQKGIDCEMLWINRQVVSDERMNEMLDAVGRADIVVLAAPLYDDCQPAIVTKTMEAIAAQQNIKSNKRFFPVINSGFPEPEQITAIAIPIYHKFAITVGFKWSGSLSIGGGEVLQGSTGKNLDDLGKMAGKVKKTLDEIAQALAAENSYPDKALRAIPDFFYKSFIPKIIARLNNSSWKSRAKKNGGVVDARPFER